MATASAGRAGGERVAPVVIAEDVGPVSAPSVACDAIVVDFGGRRRVRISAIAPAELVTAALKALK